MDNIFEQAANLARMQAEGYRVVREQARREALEEAAKVCERLGMTLPSVSDALRMNRAALEIRALKDKEAA